MLFDEGYFFGKYAQIASEADTLFDRVQGQYPAEVKCSLGCADCCYALFDLTLVEAMAVNKAFREHLDQPTRERVLERANRADRQTVKIKREANHARQRGVSTEEILRQLGKKRVRCPLLEDDNTCLLYEHRPITCRLYGIPMSSGSQTYVCGRSGFQPGGKYPTVDMDKLNDRLLALAQELNEGIATKYTKLAEVLVPLSMALLTDYDAEYLGIRTETEQKGS
jgi:Fe-S-cluster containining protein